MVTGFFVFSGIPRLLKSRNKSRNIDIKQKDRVEF